MELEFNILWVDDDDGTIESITDEIELKEWLADEGFDPEVYSFKSSQGVFEKLSGQNIDLIIVDLNLADDEMGDDLIVSIREKGYLQEIVFYSRKSLVEQKSKQKQLEGVFFVEKNEETAEEIKKLISFIINRWKQPVYVRGWIVADAILLESQINELLSKCLIERTGFSFAKRLIFEYKGAPPLDFGKRFKLLSGILKDHIKHLNISGQTNSENTLKLKSFKKVLDRFEKEIIEVRNSLAHKTKDELSTLDLEKIRKNFKKHRDNLKELDRWLSITK